MSLYLKQIEVGPMQNYAYLVGDPASKEAIVVDPAWNPKVLLAQAKEDGYKITHIFLTHGHYDHINGTEDIVGATGAVVCCEKKEWDDFIAEGMGGFVIPKGKVTNVFTGDRIKIGALDVEFIPIPGHTPGSRFMKVQFQGQTVIFTGDTLFVGTIGRADFPYSDPKALFESLNKIKKLDGSTVFYPGHDYGATSCNTIEKERKTNPFLLCDSVHQFLQMVRH